MILTLNSCTTNTLMCAYHVHTKIDVDCKATLSVHRNAMLSGSSHSEIYLFVNNTGSQKALVYRVLTRFTSVFWLRLVLWKNHVNM